MKSNELYFIFINENWLCLEWIISFQRRKIKWTAQFESTFWFIRTIKWIQLDSSHCARFVCAERQRRFRYIYNIHLWMFVYTQARSSLFFARLPLHAGWSLCKTSENILLRHKTDVQKKVQHNFYERSKSTWLNGWFCASANNSKANSKRFIQKAAVLFASLFTDRTYGL